MTVYEFCRKHTQTCQLCVIRSGGWIVETVWVDLENIFRISKLSAEAEVKKTEFGYLPVKTEHGDIVHICLYIDTQLHCKDS